MIYRLSRLRFIVVRSCIISLIIILCLQLVAFFNNDNTQSNTRNKYTKLLTAEKKFWQKLSDEDKTLSDIERLKSIEFIEKQNENQHLNWTTIFFHSYTRKLIKLNERNAKTTYKHQFKDSQENVSQQTIEIFEETLVFDRPKFCSSTRIFHPQCPYTNCRWSCEKPSMNEKNIRRASVFHHTDIKQNEMLEKLPHRSSNDIWILWIDEANRQIEHLNQYKFNWTLSFRQDSEVSIGSYGILIEKDKTNTSSDNNSDFNEILFNRYIENIDMTLENRILLNYRYRHKHALWFVSNCAPKRRLEYYEQLKSFYPINAFGTCVEKKCDKNIPCDYQQSHLALFYLAFESQTCKDYITEKFWRALYYGMIPIVLGPSKQSYLDLGVPSSAFIHVDDYQSAEELGNYLHEISNDYFLYRNYFQWLKQYDVFYNINDLEPIRMCELCMRLNMQEYRDHSFYTNVHQWHRTAC